MMAATSRQSVPPMHGPVQSCWELAIEIFNEHLTKDRKKTIAANEPSSVGYPNCKFSDVLSTAEACSDWQQHLKRNPRFRDKTKGFVHRLSRYCAPIDVMMQNSPDIAALVWGAVRFLMLITIANVEISEHIDGTISNVVEHIPRWESYQQLYPTSIPVRNAIAKLYAEIINFTIRSAKLQKKRVTIVGFAKFACTGLASKHKLEGIATRITKLSDAVENVTKAALQEAQLAFRRDWQEEKTRTDALEWLEEAMPHDVQPVEWEEGTCQWIFRHEAYREWEDGSCRGPLWIYGIAGCGKSVIASYLAQEAKTSLVFTHTYASSCDQGRAPKLALATSILAQMLKTTCNKQTGLHERLQPLLRHPSPIRCTFQALWTCCKDTLSTIPHEFTLIVDAIDECTEDDAYIKTLLEKLHLLGDELPNARVILISRYNDDYKRSLPHAKPLVIDEDAISADIKRFVEREIDRNPRLEAHRQDILFKVSTQAKGMFLWASLMMKCLKGAATTNMLKEMLHQFPIKLGAVYDKLLLNADGRLSDGQLDIRNQILMLIIAAKRPLLAAEISTAIALRSTSALDTGNMLLGRAEATISELCGHLVVVRGQDFSVELVHHSLREFLLSGAPSEPSNFRVVLEDAHESLARVCLNQLGQSSLVSADIVQSLLQCNVLERSTPRPVMPSLYEYAAFYWHEHVSTSTARHDLANQVGEFLGGLPFIVWAETLFHLTPGSDFGPVLSTRAALLQWPALGQPGIKDCIRIDQFFTGPYRSALKLPEFCSQDNVVHYLLYHRLGSYFNMAAEENNNRYKILDIVKDGAEKSLGPSHPFTLRSKKDFGLEKVGLGELTEAEGLLWQVWEVQSKNNHGTDQYETLCMYAVTLYFQVRLEESIAFQNKASEGLLRGLGPENKKYLRSQIFLAWALEASGQLDSALAIYENIRKIWVPMNTHDKGGLTLVAREGIATVQGKKGNYNVAIEHGAQVLASQREMLGDASFITADVALNLVILYIGSGQYAEAHRQLSGVLALGEINRFGTAAETHDDNNGKLWYHRSCLARCLQASLHVRCGKKDQAMQVLKGLLYDAGDEKRRSNRELLRARLLMAECLRSSGRLATETEALQCFAGLVLPVENNKTAVANRGGELHRSASHEIFMLEAAEKATRQFIRNDVVDAQKLLMENGLRWRRNEDYWFTAAGPFAEVEWRQTTNLSQAQSILEI